MEEDASSRPTMISTEKIRRERRRTAGRRRSIILVGSQFEKPKPKGDPWVVPSKGVLRMLCRICGKKDVHWSFKCPNIALQTTSVNRSSTEPPICQVCNQPADVIKLQEASVHVINLPKEICESDLIDLVRRFGPLTRVSLSMDEESDRKAAVVVYDRTKDAEKAISLFNGYDYHNSIFRVEWAKPRQEAAYPPACPTCLEASENCVRVFNISKEITGPVFLDLFCRSGLLSVAYLDADKMTGSQTKCGIVEYFRKEDAKKAIRLINGLEFFDLELQVQGPFRLHDLHRDLGVQVVF